MKQFHENPIKYSNYSDPTNSKNELAGGKKEEWKIFLEKLSQISEHPKALSNGTDMGELAYVKQYNRLETPVVLNGETSTFLDLAMHASIRQRLSKGTIERNLRYLRFMERHPCPVNLRKPTLENFIRHMDYREQLEGCEWGALKHQWQAMIMLLRAYGINTKEWYYKPPKRAQYKTIPIPFPEQVHKIIHMTYSDDKYENALARYILCHNYVIGWRPPSEPCILKTKDVDIDKGILKVTSPKLYGATRYLDISEIASKHNSLSFENWLKWRSKVENQYSGDYFYLKPDGHPFENPNQLRGYLYRFANEKIKQVFPEYYNYTSRHFCAIARLIRTKMETKKFDEYTVYNWMGHTKIESTMGYIKHAEFYYLKAPYDWIKCVLKFYDNGVEGENTLKIDKPPKNLGYEWNSSERARRRPPDSNRRPLG